MSETTETQTAIDPEVMTDEIEKRRPSVPATINELAALEDQGEAILGSRARIWHSVRIAAIQETSPEDWVLYRAVDQQSGEERITAYLQDSGCGRIRPLLGIDVFPPFGKNDFPFERTAIKVVEKDKDGNEAEKGEFAYSVIGDGKCNFTGREERGVIGTRYSQDKDAAEITDPLKKELRVKGNARVNLDGNITRKLAGMKVVPIQELDKAWEGTGKSSKKCPWGRGFADKRGADVKGPGGIEPPVCESCGAKMQFHNGGNYQGKPYEAYWKCAQWQYNEGKGNGHSKIKAKQWEEMQAKQAAAKNEPPKGA